MILVIVAISPSYVVPILGSPARPTAPSCTNAVDLESKRTMTSPEPVLKWNYTGVSADSIVVVDIDQDGQKEVLLFSLGGIYCLNMTGGLKWRCETGSWISVSPSIADVDGDGKLEVVLGESGWGLVRCLNSTGSLKWNSTTTSLTVYSPVIADINGDGKPEILVPTDEGITCLDGTTGARMWNSTGGVTGGVGGPIAVGDIDRDGKQEVLAVATPSDYGLHEGCHLNIACLNCAGGLKWIWNGPDRSVSLDPVVFDVDGDGKLEVIVACSVLWSLPGGVYCLNGIGGLKWNYTKMGDVMASPVVSDVDRDGKQEIVVDTHGDVVYCLNGTGALEWRGCLGGFWHHTWECYFPPVVADLNGDGCQEIVGMPDIEPTLRCLDGKTGRVMWNYTTGEWFNPSHRCAFVVSDVEGDGERKVIVARLGDGNLSCLNSMGGLDWNYSIGESLLPHPTAADVDGDNKSELIVCSRSGKVYCIGFPFTPPESGSYYSLIQAVSLTFVVGLAVGLTFLTVVMVRRRTLRAAGLERKDTCFPWKV